jgi:hypothetical protein
MHDRVVIANYKCAVVHGRQGRCNAVLMHQHREVGGEPTVGHDLCRFVHPLMSSSASSYALSVVGLMRVMHATAVTRMFVQLYLRLSQMSMPRAAGGSRGWPRKILHPTHRHSAYA